MVVLILSLFTFFGVNVNMGLRSVKKEIIDNQLRYQQYAPQLNKIKEQTIINEIRDNSPQWEEVFRELSNIIPPNIYLESLKFQDEELIIQGAMRNASKKDDPVLSTFLLNMGEGMFKNIILVSSEEDSKDAGKFEFTIKCIVDY